MIVNKSLLQEIFRGFYIQRWNDRIRPMELLEMDKHAHKMIIAYCIGKYEEERGANVNWSEIIKGGVYELFRRITISDIKSPIYNKIRKYEDVFNRLNNYVFNELEEKISSSDIKNELSDFLFKEDYLSDLSSRILQSAHILASYWEFNIIRLANPQSYQNVKIETELLNTIDSYKDLIGVKKIIRRHTISNFVDLFGQLRFQIRWAQLPRIPKTSVLGHSLLVACISYFFARENDACEKRIYNDFFGGLFHDLPEAVTRDIISPVKKSSKEFEKLLKEIETELADEEIFPLVENEWIDEIKYFTQTEFQNKAIIDNGNIEDEPTTDEMNEKYNENRYSPYDGRLVKSADVLSAFLEVWNSCNSGIKTEELLDSVEKIKREESGKQIGSVNLNEIYGEFESFAR